MKKLLLNLTNYLLFYFNILARLVIILTTIIIFTENTTSRPLGYSIIYLSLIIFVVKPFFDKSFKQSKEDQ